MVRFRGLVRFVRMMIVCSAILGVFQAEGASLSQFEPRLGGDRLLDALLYLHRTKTGHLILQDAIKKLGLKKTEDLRAWVSWGETSRTDSVLTRRFDSVTGVEEKKTTTLVSIKSKIPDEELLLDLVHELTHAVYRQPLDPYNPQLSPLEYIRVGIEGEGGEVEALINECHLDQEIHLNSGRCQKYLRLSREQVTKEFYRVGKWKAEISRRLANQTSELKWLSSASSQLISSTGQAPYPVSLLHEYDEITEVACQNTMKLLEALGGVKSSAQERQPASEEKQHEKDAEPSVRSRQNQARLFLKNRCSDRSE